MKVEYSYFLDAPCMVIKGADFRKALCDDEEFNLLYVAVEAFCKRVGSPNHFNDDVNEVIKSWLEKNGNVIYRIQQKWIAGRCAKEWCEVCVQNGTRTINIVISYTDGWNFALQDKKGVPHE